MTNADSKAKRIRDIEDEFGEPFRDIIIGFRQQKCSWDVIAGSIEMPVSTLRRWARENGLLDGVWNTPKTRVRPLDERARTLGYKGAADMHVELRLSGKTRIEVAAELECCDRSLYLRYTPDMIKGMIAPWVLEKSRSAGRNRRQ